jgi:diguanylate cyclase (GGDEF)-like protein
MSTESPLAPRSTAPKRSAILWYASVFVIFVCIALLATDAWFAWNNRKSDLLEAETNVANLTQALAQHAEDAVKKADTVLFGLVERLEVGSMDPIALQRLFPLLVARIAELPELQGLFIYDENGRWLVNSIDDVPADMNNSDRAYFIYHRDHAARGPHVGSPVRSKSTGDWIIPVSRRINHPDGSFAGVVLATVKMEYFNRYYASFDIGKSGAILLTLADATVLVRRPYMESLIGKNIGERVLFSRYIKQRSNDTLIMTSGIDGMERLISYRSLELYPLVIVAALSKQEVLQAWRIQTLRQALGVFLLAAMVALLGLRLVKQIGMHDLVEHELYLAQQKVLAVNKTLQRLALQDSLTGLANRRQFDLTLNSEYDRAIREQRSIALLMIDVDYFKRFNDLYGHPEGDTCLRKVAQVMQAKRPGDFSARYGGEEFCVILAETELKGALVVAESIRAAIRGLALPHTGNPAGFVTVSIGVTAAIPSTFGSGPLAFLQAADQALYMAKGAGRNQVCASDDNRDESHIGRNSPAQ